MRKNVQMFSTFPSSSSSSRRQFTISPATFGPLDIIWTKERDWSLAESMQHIYKHWKWVRQQRSEITIILLLVLGGKECQYPRGWIYPRKNSPSPWNFTNPFLLKVPKQLQRESNVGKTSIRLLFLLIATAAVLREPQIRHKGICFRNYIPHSSASRSNYHRDTYLYLIPTTQPPALCCQPIVAACGVVGAKG